MVPPSHDSRIAHRHQGGSRWAFQARLLVAVLGVSALVTATAAVAEAQPVLAAGAERPWSSDWASFSCESPDRIRAIRSPVARGARAYSFEVRDGDDSFGERCELGQGNPTRAGFPLFQEGDERWISWSVYLPSDFPLDTSRWNVLNQWKQLGALGVPILSMEAKNGRFHLINDANGTQWSGPAARQRWASFTLHVKFSPDRSVGFVELYGDPDGKGRRLLLRKKHTNTMKRDGSGRTVPSHARIGIYRDPRIQGTAHAYFDDYVISATPPRLP